MRLRDLKNAARGLSRKPRLALVMTATLALALGANTTIFSLVKSVLFVDASFGANTGRVISVHSTHPARAQQLDDARLSWTEFEGVRGANAGLSQVEAFVWRNVTLQTDEGALRAEAISITPGLFNLIDARPAQGRLLNAEDAADFGHEPSVLLSHGLWERQYGGDARLLGRDVTVNGRKLRVVGVMPKGFAFPVRTELWLAYQPVTPPPEAQRFLNTVALLKAGEDAPSVERKLASLGAELERRYPASNRGFHIQTARFPASLIGGTPVAMGVLLAAVTMVLLVACANLAGLLVARSVEKRKELALKAALGASHGALMREILSEVFLVSLAGTALGWGLASWATPRLVASFPETPPYWMRFDVDGVAFLYCLGLTLVATLVAGLFPAWRLASIEPVHDLKDGARSVTRSGPTRFLQEGIVVTQVALCLALVVLSQLLIGSFVNLQNADSGVVEDGLLTFRAYLSGDAVDAVAARTQAVARLVDVIQDRPSVTSVAITSSIPADDGGTSISVVKDAGARPEDEIPTTLVAVSDGAFAAMGRGLVRGRDFSRSEASDPQDAHVVLSASLASALGNGPNLVGSTVLLREGVSDRSRTVIGITPDVQYEEFGEETRALRNAVYVPYAAVASRRVAVLVRTSGRPDALVRELRGLAASAYPGLAVFDVRTMSEVRQLTTWEQRFIARLMGLLAIATFLLAGMGLYGLLRQFVASSTHEIGVRRALGAPNRAILGLVLSRAGLVAAIGIAAGGVIASLGARAMSGILFGIGASSPGVLAGTAFAVAALVFMCAWIPTSLALKVDPLTTLRAD
jgi:putative ABC transport system permease protein